MGLTIPKRLNKNSKIKSFFVNTKNSLNHFAFGRKFKIIDRKEETVTLININKRELAKQISLDLILEYKFRFSSIETNYLEDYIKVLKADYEEWSTFSAGIASFSQAITVIFITLLVNKFLYFDISSSSLVQTFTYIILLVFLFVIISLLTISPSLLYRKIALKKSKAKLFIEIIEDILNERKSI